MPDKDGRFPPVFITQVPWHEPNAAEAKQAGQTQAKQDEAEHAVPWHDEDWKRAMKIASRMAARPRSTEQTQAKQDEAEHAAYLEWHRAGQRQARQDEAANCDCEECSCADNTDDHAA